MNQVCAAGNLVGQKANLRRAQVWTTGGDLVTEYVDPK